MMSTIAGEGTNSDGREATMTGQEREKTDAEMTGTTGKKEMWEKLRGLSVKQDSAIPHEDLSSSTNLQDATKWWLSGALTLSATEFGDNICFNFNVYLLKSTFQRVGQGQGTTQPWRVSGL